MTQPKYANPILVLAALLVFANVYGNEFLFDDEFLILKNGYLDSFDNLKLIFTSSSTAGAGFTDSFYRPVQTLAYLIVNQLFGRVPYAFHALNVGVHAVNAILVRGLGRRLGLKPAAAFAAALLWVVHPLHVEAVTYASATADVLHAFFVLAALNVALGGARPTRTAAGLALGAAAVLSKESAVTLPALLVACRYLVAARPSAWRTYVPTLPYWVLTGAYFVLRRGLLHFADADAFPRTAGMAAAAMPTRLYTSLATIPAYLGLLLWPHDLHMDRDFPIFTDPWSASVLVGLVIAGLGAWSARRGTTRPPAARWAGFAALWALAAHAPHAGVLLPVNSVFLEHWMYLTALPLFFATGRALDWVAQERPRWALAATVVLAVTLGQKTFDQNRAWANPIDFFTRTLAYNPTSARIRHNLAMAYSARGDDTRALEQYELMIAAGTPYAQTFHNAAIVLNDRRDTDRAERYFRRALELDPHFYPSAQNLALIYAARGDLERARAYQDLSRRDRPAGPTK